MTGTRLPGAGQHATLPEGRAGQLLAVLLLLVALALAWSALVQPLLAWHEDRAAALDSRRLFAARAEALAATLPALRAERQRAAAAGPAQVPVLDGASDAVAGAALQQAVGDMAGRLGITLATAELLPAEPAGAYRRIRLRVTLQAPWPAIVALLDAIAAARPGMVVDDLRFRAAPTLAGLPEPPLDASWTILAFRTGAAS